MSEKRSLLLPLLGVALLANAGGAIYMAQRFAGMEARLAAAETAVQQYRFERTSTYGGIGFNALLDHLARWAPELQKGGNLADRKEILERVEEIVHSMAQLQGSGSMIAAALRGGDAAADDPASQDELRKWLLRAAYGNDDKLGLQLYEQVLRNEGFAQDCSSRLRLVAARNLLDIDRERCGEILHELIRADSSSTRQLSKQSLRKGQMRGNFFNFIDCFVATDHPRVDQTLMRLLKLQDIDLIALQTCVTHLGERRYQPAAADIKQLYFKQQPVPGQVPNPIFRRKCVVAVDLIEGAKAKPFFAKVDQRESDLAIQELLNKIKLKYGSLH